MNMLFGDHRGKQLAFLKQLFHTEEYWKHNGFIKSKGLDQLKQNAIYIGLSKPQSGKPRTDGKITKPSDITKAHTRKKIKLIHNFLIEFCEDRDKGGVNYGPKAFDNVFNLRLLEKLQDVEL